MPPSQSFVTFNSNYEDLKYNLADTFLQLFDLFILPMRTKIIMHPREGRHFSRSIRSGFFVLRLMAQLPIPA